MLSAIHAISRARTSSSLTSRQTKARPMPRENEGQATVAHLLVGAHVLQQPVRRAATAREEPRVDRQAGDREVPADTTNVVGGGEASRGEPRGRRPGPSRWRPPRRAAGRRRSGFRLQRMTEGMAQVEQRARSSFPLVLGDDRRLRTAAAATAWRSAAGSPARIRSPFASSHSKNELSPSSPYLTISA